MIAGTRLVVSLLAATASGFYTRELDARGVSAMWYDENCVPTNYNAAASWVEGDKLHAFKVTSPTTAHLMAVFVTAQVDALRTDQPAPACDTGNLGL